MRLSLAGFPVGRLPRCCDRSCTDLQVHDCPAVYHLLPAQVPTFIFYRNGEEVGRHVGSSRGDLIGQILAQQARMQGAGALA